MNTWTEHTNMCMISPRLCGFKDWMKDDGSRYIIFYYRADKFSGELKASEEGEVFWAELSELPGMNLAVDMELTLKVLLNEKLSEFYYEKVDGRGERHLL